jgi:hypothetical protein
MARLVDPQRKREQALCRRAVQAVKDSDVDTFNNLLGEADSWWCQEKLFRAIARAAPRPSEAFRHGFLIIWKVYGDKFRDQINDVVLVWALPFLLPRYRGRAVRLYRGCGVEQGGLSWTSNLDAARSFALGTAQHCDAQIIETLAPAKAIICAPALIDDDDDEAEYVVDWRRLRKVRVLERFRQ